MFLWPVRVYYEDTDSGGVIYYANYLRYMERARTEWLRGIGIEQDKLVTQQGVIFAVKSVRLDFEMPGKFNDLLHVGVYVIHLGRASITFKQQVMRLGSDITDHVKDIAINDENKTILCSGEIKVACLNALTFKPQRIPEIILTEITCDS